MMDATDRLIVNRLQGGFPVSGRPFADAASLLGLGETELLDRLGNLIADGTLSRFGPLYNPEALGGGLTLAAMAVPPERFDAVAEIVNGFVEVAHNYEREHELNMWFVVATERPERIAGVLEEIRIATGLEVYDMPKQEEFFLEFRVQA
jgi:DNA-binding Lrp family transcriptional regulator